MTKRFINVLISILCSSLVFITLLACPAEPQPPEEKKEIVLAPQGVRSNSKTPDSISLTWNSIDGVTLYYIYRSDVADGVYSKIGISETNIYIDRKGLIDNRVYFYRVSSSDLGASIGEKEKTIDIKVCSNYFEAYTALQLPVHFIISSKNAGSTVLDWPPVAGANRYVIYRTHKLSEKHVVVYDSAITGDTPSAGGNYTFTDTELIDGGTYYYQLKCFNDKTDSNDTLKISVVMDIRIPDNIICSTDNNNGVITINWNKVKAENLLGYRVYRAYSVDGTYTEIHTGNLNTEYFQYVVPPTDKGKLLYFKVASIIGGIPGNKSTFVETALRPDPPTLPSSYNIISSTTETVVNLSWVNPKAGAGVLIERVGPTADDIFKEKVIGLDKQDFSDSSLNRDTLYEYTLYTYVELKYSKSGEKSLILSLPISKKGIAKTLPQGINIIEKNGTTGEVTLTWTKSQNAKSYEIFCRKSIPGGGGGTDDYLSIETISGPAESLPTTYKHTNRDPLTKYYYFVRVHGQNNINDSQPISCTTMAPEPQGPLLVTNQTINSVKLEWAQSPLFDPAKYEDSYIIKYKEGKENRSIEVTTSEDPVVSGKWTYTLSGLYSGSSYDFEVYSVFKDITTSESIASTTFITERSYTCPDKPVIELAEASGNSINLKIKGQTKRYQVYLSSGGTTLPARNVEATSYNGSRIYNFTIDNVSCFTDYQIKVVAETESWADNWGSLKSLSSVNSNEALVTTGISSGILNLKSSDWTKLPGIEKLFNFDVELSWPVLSGVKKIEVKRVDKSGTVKKIPLDLGSSTLKDTPIERSSTQDSVEYTYTLIVTDPNDLTHEVGTVTAKYP